MRCSYDSSLTVFSQLSLHCIVAAELSVDETMSEVEIEEIKKNGYMGYNPALMEYLLDIHRRVIVFAYLYMHAYIRCARAPTGGGAPLVLGCSSGRAGGLLRPC